MTIQITRGRRLIRPARRAHSPVVRMPCSASTTSGSNFGRRGQKTARPQSSSSAGEQGESGEHREDDADGGDGSERAVRLQIAEQQAQQAGDHRAARGHDRLEGALPGGGDGGALVLDDTELLAESRDEEQGVVGRRADHQDEEDALGLTAEQQDLELREPPHHEQRDAEREEARRQHDQRQQE